MAQSKQLLLRPEVTNRDLRIGQLDAFQPAHVSLERPAFLMIDADLGTLTGLNGCYASVGHVDHGTSWASLNVFAALDGVRGRRQMLEEGLAGVLGFGAEVKPQ